MEIPNTISQVMNLICKITNKEITCLTVAAYLNKILARFKILDSNWTNIFKQNMIFEFSEIIFIPKYLVSERKHK